MEVVARAKPGGLEARWAAAHHHLRHRVRGGCGGFLKRHPAALQRFHLLLALQRRAAVAELQQAQTGGARERQIVRVSCDSMVRVGVANSWVQSQVQSRTWYLVTNDSKSIPSSGESPGSAAPPFSPPVATLDAERDRDVAECVCKRPARTSADSAGAPLPHFVKSIRSSLHSSGASFSENSLESSSSSSAPFPPFPASLRPRPPKLPPPPARPVPPPLPLVRDTGGAWLGASATNASTSSIDAPRPALSASASLALAPSGGGCTTVNPRCGTGGVKPMRLSAMLEIGGAGSLAGSWMVLCRGGSGEGCSAKCMPCCCCCSCC